MPRLPVQTSSFSPALLNEDLADREGLTGRARQNFLAFLAAIERPVRPGGWRLLLLVSFIAGLLSLLLATWPGNLSPLFAPLWMGFSLLGIGFALGLRRAERTPVRHDPELNWRVYCLVLRPVLLAEKPGLLDRNLPADRSVQEQVEVRPTEVCRNIYRDRGADFWWSSIIGLWVGMSALLVCHFGFEVSVTWTWGFPVAGLLLGPLIWSIIQWFAWHLSRTRPWLQRW